VLKVSVIDSRTRRRLVLEGTLIAPWVAELRSAWKAANADLQDRKLVVDLRNVTLIGEDGEEVLSELMSEGARFSCDGVLTKHVLQQLTRRSKRKASELIRATQPSAGEQALLALWQAHRRLVCSSPFARTLCERLGIPAERSG